jgi:hypothetical protein
LLIPKLPLKIVFLLPDPSRDLISSRLRFDERRLLATSGSKVDMVSTFSLTGYDSASLLAVPRQFWTSTFPLPTPLDVLCAPLPPEEFNERLFVSPMWDLDLSPIWDAEGLSS